MKIRSFRELDVWKKAHALTLEVYRVTNQFPRSELFGAVSQLRRAASSVPANIAEGFGRRTTRELLRSLMISRGSLEEVRYFLLLGKDLRYLPTSEFNKLDNEITSVAQMLSALSRSLGDREAAKVPKVVSRVTNHESRVTA